MTFGGFKVGQKKKNHQLKKFGETTYPISRILGNSPVSHLFQKPFVLGAEHTVDGRNPKQPLGMYKAL